MHEVSIAQNILEIIKKEVKKNNASSVHVVNLVIGEFTCIVKEALEFALDVVKKNTLAQNTEFRIETVKLKTYCECCDKYYSKSNEFYFLCPSCSGKLNIVEGQEMYIDFIDLE